ncbi:hypothetical protein GCM10008098_18310 [Rhodanobacter panaciterrae]|uniref:Uncharacterized protein n=1 Tax=Rhodanobacter panaciterrae TaxID=490572 RepID=A0ABQ2ZWT3_9GAMM|nr:hypothetical protein [Rhodanobacter panaciterrae]GGY24997.1 hypothetical protein GCM10008098_18310 [Rhodanobacter panaciterrae]
MSAQDKYEADFGADLDSVIMEASKDTLDFSYLRTLLRKPSEANAIEIGLEHDISAEVTALCYMFAQAHMAEKWLGTLQVIFSREKDVMPTLITPSSNSPYFALTLFWGGGLVL